ncbi:MAG: hypothetical protein KAW12_07720 [Candidatus Aminicenantes bacterium]|nr:hypothetical protein [Candidatus Aminicenantes bacterium]
MTNNKLSIIKETQDPLFAAYTGEEKKFFNRLKKPRSLTIIFTAAATILLSVFFYINASGRLSIDEVAAAIKIACFDSQWVEKEVTPIGVKLVPSITMKVKNTGDKPLKHINFIGIFEFMNETLPAAHGSGGNVSLKTKNAPKKAGKQLGDGNAYMFTKPLMPGETSEEIFIKSKFGYRASSKTAFIENAAEWKPVKAIIYIKTGTGLAQIGKIEVKRQIAGLKLTGKTKISEMNKTPLPLQAIYLDSKWLDKKITRGKAVIVPSLTLKLQNNGKELLQDIYLKAVFELEKSGEVMGEGFLRLPGDGLQPGETSREILIKAGFGGYTARSKTAFIKNRNLWQRVNAKVLVRSGFSGYTLLGTFPIKKEVQGVKVIYRIGS